MNPEQQRIAIAEACGWKKGDLRPSWCHPDNWSMAKNGSHEVWVSQDKLPNYLKDLNAMHEARKVLTYDQQIDYSRHIGKMVTSHLPASRAAWMDYGLINATATQHAEAFLRTIGKWEESK